MFSFISNQKKKLQTLRGNVQKASRFFHALALAQAYGRMLQEIEQRTRGHPEVARVPELVQILIDHFKLYANEHISIERNEIFNPDFLETLAALDDWQEAGYPMSRSDEDYPWRVRVFRAIWSGTPITVTLDRISKRGNAFKQQITFTPLNPETRQPTSYAEIIRARNENYSDVVRYIPFWYPLNYGTGGIGVNPGYPDVPGLHFIDVSEQYIELYKRQTLGLMGRYYASALTNFELEQPEEWARSHVSFQSSHIDIFSLARQVTDGA